MKTQEEKDKRALEILRKMSPEQLQEIRNYLDTLESPTEILTQDIQDRGLNQTCTTL